MTSRPESRLPRRRTRLAVIAVTTALFGLIALSGVAWALYTGTIRSSGDQLVAAPDWVAPTVASSLIGKTQGGVPGYIHQGGTYNVYANVSDTGGPASGVSSVNGNLSSVSTGLTSSSLPAGSYSIGGTSYGFRSASLTANATLAEGTDTYPLSSTDSAGNARTQSGYSVIVDNTVPTASDIQTTNKSGNIAGRPDIGDTVIYTFSEAIDPNSILANWTGASTNIVARITDSASSDSLTLFNATNVTQLPLGSTNLAGNYVTASATFGLTGTASTMVQSGNTITITLGTASSGPATAGGTGAMIWSPSATATDRAANAESTATRTETGTADKDF
ncbi:MAG: large repetitive protein [Solirubrobacterales bacterium]|jgi:hypothetical protein|nr:large repetitive protein [Solirubrobacterales bacterium]